MTARRHPTGTIPPSTTVSGRRVMDERTMKCIGVTVVLALLAAGTLGQGTAARAADGNGQPAVTVIAVGDIACDPTSPHFNGGEGDAGFCHMKATAELALGAHPDAVLALGDNQYEDATLSAFEQSYDPTWGRLKALTYPVVGNHEYQTPGAAGYFDYFGSRSAPSRSGYYSFDIGSWHMIALNSECKFAGGCNAGDPQEQWLLSDLAAHRNLCTLAFWHSPRFTSGRNRNHPELAPLWDDLYAYGVELVLNGHDHIYERFAPQNPAQKADPNRGIRELIVGTGGNNHQPNYGSVQPNSEVRDNTTYGVVQLSLRSDSYDWKFIPAKHAGNGHVTDAGTGTCHGINAGSETSTGPRAVPVVSASGSAGVIGRFAVDSTSTGAGHAYVMFGPGPGCSGLIMTATRDDGAGTTRHHLVVTGDDLAGASGNLGVLPGTTYWFEIVTQTPSATEIDNNAGKCYSVTLASGT